MGVSSERWFSGGVFHRFISVGLENDVIFTRFCIDIFDDMWYDGGMRGVLYYLVWILRKMGVLQ